jgi:hypothetical protein
VVERTGKLTAIGIMLNEGMQIWDEDIRRSNQGSNTFILRSAFLRISLEIEWGELTYLVEVIGLKQCSFDSYDIAGESKYSKWGK